MTCPNKIDKSWPALVIDSTPCTMFSRLQQLNLHVHVGAWRAKFEIEKKNAIAHIVFCLKVFRLQIARGADFLMEHQAYADSWKCSRSCLVLRRQLLISACMG